MTDLHYWLALAHLPGIGPVTAARWLEKVENISALFKASNSELKTAGLSDKEIHHLRKADQPAAEKELAWCEKNACHIVTLNHPNYPRLLREIYDAPILLYARGNLDLLSEPQLAIVGSRNPTATGAMLANDFAKQLAQAGLTITSGLALGIDAASHRGTLSVSGKTIAVLGTGIQHIYPYSHRTLADEIIEKGLLISEFPLNTPPKAKNFPLRNRVISGLSLGVLVIEAALRSGSLITARTAMEQNRNVFAVPGSIHNPLARGCHQLLRQGAKLVETASDILEDLGALNAVLTKSRVPAAPQELVDIDPELQPVLAQVGLEVTPLDVVVVRSGLTPSLVSSMLLSLELSGHVGAVPGGYVRLVNKVT